MASTTQLRCLRFAPLLIVTTVPLALAETPPGETPALGEDRIRQDDIVDGQLDLREIRRAGLEIFATPFNALDGFGDGPADFAEPTQPGGRPSLQDNGTFLRVNGLDAQTCMECHSVGSNATVPFTFAVGGAGGANNNAIFQPTEIDVDDEAGNGFAAFDGRFINPPFLFGSGGVELIGREMTDDLQQILARARREPGRSFELRSKGVEFGRIRVEPNGEVDTSEIEGIDADLVVRPFGRKGEFATVRGFDLGALNFHFGMQPVEEVGEGVDGDGDGIADEVLVGEVSALHIFNTNLERPEVREFGPTERHGFGLFQEIGCSGCHVPELTSDRRRLTYSHPEVPEDPFSNVYYAVDLVAGPAGFEAHGDGLRVPMFSDLKRHDLGPELAESFGSELDSEFITARLWGVADTAPYLHDGRATTLTDAILAHGGEADSARDAFEGLPDEDRIAVLALLRALRTPLDPAADIR